MALITYTELQSHSSTDDCWLLVNGKVWDLTEFAKEHPGGDTIIYKHAGRNATTVYNSIHPPSLITRELGESKMMGEFDSTSAPEEPMNHPTSTLQSHQLAEAERRPLESIINSYDFEEAAKENLSEKAWAFFSSAATDCITQHANISYYSRIFLRPAILRDIRSVNYKTKMLGADISMPLFVSPTALSNLAHPDGELAIAKGCSGTGIAQIISTNASIPIGDITSAADIPFFFQLYVNKDRTVSEKFLQKAEQCGARGVFVTVDQPTAGKREADERTKTDFAAVGVIPSGAAPSTDSKGNGLSRSMAGMNDSSLNWKDIAWLRRVTKMPIVLKGVQTAEDAIKAIEHGVDGILIGNHGGRSLDTSSPSIMILIELQRKCPQVLQQLEVYIDGGIRRGTDIFKALCLGARAVGMGRQFLYAANYGPEGVSKLIEIMKDEFDTTMRMMGCTDLSQLHPGLLNLSELHQWFLDPLLPGINQSNARPKL